MAILLLHTAVYTHCVHWTGKGLACDPPKFDLVRFLFLQLVVFQQLSQTANPHVSQNYLEQEMKAKG